MAAVWAAAARAMLAPGAGVAQAWPEEGPPGAARAALVLDDDGWRTPTPDEALRLLVEGPPGEGAGWAAPALNRPDYEPVIGILAQRFEARPRAELDALADALVALILEDDPERGQIRDRASFALVVAANSDKARPGEPSTPYRGAFDAFRTVYETLAARALAGGGDDPFDVLERPMRGVYRVSAEAETRYSRLMSALRDIFVSDPDGRGRDYLLELIASSGPPEPGAAGSVWCQASYILIEGENALFEDPDPNAVPDPDAYYAHCRRMSPRRE